MASPREWRARWRSPVTFGAGPALEAFELLLEALEHNPHALAIHQAIWNTLSCWTYRRPSWRATSSARGSRCSISIRMSASLPVSQYRTAVAVPALPRMEHVRGGSDRARHGHRAEIPASFAH
jgi:hypothetical protein